MFIIQKFDEVCTKTLQATDDAERKAVLHAELEQLVLPRRFQLPLDPHMECRGVHVEKCKVMSSAKKPLWLVLHNAVRSKPPHLIIFKAGDDLRQDELTLQVIKQIDRLWKNAGLDMRMSPYV